MSQTIKERTLAIMKILEQMSTDTFTYNPTIDVLVKELGEIRQSCNHVYQYGICTECFKGQ